nr:uncharacterized protein LOC109119102 [Solanum lycopersicum]
MVMMIRDSLSTANSLQKLYANNRKRALEFKQVGNVDYKSQLSKDLASVHPLFYLSMFKKFLGDLTSILLVEGLGVDEILSYAKVPIEILDPQVKRLRNKDIIVKVLWRNHLVEGATCVAEADMRSRYPHLFSS